MAGWTYETWFPFKRTTYTVLDADGGTEVDTWAPGWEFELPDEYGNARQKWGGDGAMLLTVVSLHKPGPTYPERAFYVRQWRGPSGHVFGRNGLRVVAARALRAWLSGSKTKHLFEDRQAALASSSALLRKWPSAFAPPPWNLRCYCGQDGEYTGTPPFSCLCGNSLWPPANRKDGSSPQNNGPSQ